MRPTGPPANLRLSTPTGRWVLASAILGSGMVFLDSTVVNVALPTLGRSLHTGIAGLQWTVNAYMLTLASWILLGGSLGDRFGRRRIFVLGAVWFALASLLCGLATTLPQLVAARALQGVGGALLTPGSLALIQSSFHPDDRGRAVGMWSGMTGIASAFGPFVGGWLVSTVGWRSIFLINLPMAAAVIFASRHVPESSGGEEGRVDRLGALLAAAFLCGITFALIHAGERGFGHPTIVLSIAVGLLAGAAFIWVEHRSPAPMLPLELFRSRTFTAANVITLFAYAALGGLLFFFVLFLQVVVGDTPLEAGVSLLPISGVMLILSPQVGRICGATGPRVLIGVGSLVAAVALFLLSRVGASPSYWSQILPCLLLFSVGLANVAVPVTIAVLGSVPPSHVGVASGVNNAVARAAGLLAVAALPLLTGLSGEDYRMALLHSFPHAIRICAALLVLASACAWLGLKRRSVR